MESLNSIAGLAIVTDREQEDEEREILYDQKSFSVRSVARKKEEQPDETPLPAAENAGSPEKDPSPKKRGNRKKGKAKKNASNQANDMAELVKKQDKKNFGEKAAASSPKAPRRRKKTVQKWRERHGGSV